MITRQYVIVLIDDVNDYVLIERRNDIIRPSCNLVHLSEMLHRQQTTGRYQ